MVVVEVVLAPPTPTNVEAGGETVSAPGRLVGASGVPGALASAIEFMETRKVAKKLHQRED